VNERLLDVDDSILCVIDVQPGFVDKIGESEGRGPFVQRVVWVTALATALGVPTVVTEEELAHNGPTLPEIVERLAAPTPRYAKPTFGLADVPEILAAVEATGRRTAVLVGMETDVCVAHSALGLLDSGHRVVVVEDAVGSPGAAHGSGLERMRRAGVVSVVTKQLHYEWMRTVERSRAFTDAHPGLAEPPGVLL